MNLAAQESEVTPLHVAAARGLEQHVALYLEHGANVGLRTSQGETALNAACASAEGPGSSRQHEAAARRLLEAGADPRAAGRKRHTPLHNACANGCGVLAELLLRHGACAGAPNGAGHTPMDCALQAVQDAPNWEPEILFAALLDYGAQAVHPQVHGGGPGQGSSGWMGKPRTASGETGVLETETSTLRAWRAVPGLGWEVMVEGVQQKREAKCSREVEWGSTEAQKKKGNRNLNRQMWMCLGFGVACTWTCLARDRHGAPVTLLHSQMLKHCANFPRALEVLLNAYPCVPSCDSWMEAVLPELWQV